MGIIESIAIVAGLYLVRQIMKSCAANRSFTQAEIRELTRSRSDYRRDARRYR